jgi:hypothetical protein
LLAAFEAEHAAREVIQAAHRQAAAATLDTLGPSAPPLVWPARGRRELDGRG